MKSNTKQFPKNKIAWLWENMEGKRALYFVGILGTVLYNILQLTIPYFSGKIVDLFLTGENAATNLQVHRDLLYRLLFAMVGFTFLRVIVVYGSCMIYETVSQSVLYRVRNYLYDKLQRQAAADFLEQAGEGEYCFVENTGLQAVEAKIEKIIVFWWNRHYPSDRKFDLDLSKWNKVSEEEFAGYSHEKITKEVYEK